jgi:hypothetical protein
LYKSCQIEILFQEQPVNPEAKINKDALAFSSSPPNKTILREKQKREWKELSEKSQGLGHGRRRRLDLSGCLAETCAELKVRKKCIPEAEAGFLRVAQSPPPAFLLRGDLIAS